MPFNDIFGQDRAIGTLRAALRRGALHHAYLFGGPAGTGKGDVARALAQAANCEVGDRVDDACGRCAPCRKIARGVHPDVFVLSDERSMVKAGRWEPRSGRRAFQPVRQPRPEPHIAQRPLTGLRRIP